MGANFEIEIVSAEYIPIHRLDEIWSAVGSNARFRESLIYPDLFFDRTKELPFKEMDMTPRRAERLLRDGFVLYYTGLAGETVSIGAVQYMEAGRFWRSSLWFDTQGRERFDTSSLTPEVESLCCAADRCLSRENVLFCAMGVEMMTEDAASVLETRSWPTALALRFYQG